MTDLATLNMWDDDWLSESVASAIRGVIVSFQGHKDAHPRQKGLKTGKPRLKRRTKTARSDTITTDV